MSQKITPFLWFNTQAEEAAKFNAGIFKNSSVGKVTRYGKEGFEVHQMPEGTAMTVEFQLEGLDFVGLNGGPAFKFNEAVSFHISCEDQAEVDYFWEKLLADGGEESVCGWLKDKHGVSWQVIPKAMGELMSDPDPAKAGRVMAAMLKMVKIDIAELEKAAEGK